MGVVQEMNYGSPKSRNVGSDLERRPFRRVLHSRHGFSRHQAPRSACHFEDPDVVPNLGRDRSRPGPEEIPSEPRTGSGSSRDLVT